MVPGYKLQMYVKQSTFLRGDTSLCQRPAKNGAPAEFQPFSFYQFLKNITILTTQLREENEK